MTRGMMLGPGHGGFIEVEVTTTTQAMTANRIYRANHATDRVVFTLPSTAAEGDMVAIIGVGPGGWRLGQNAGQIQDFGEITSTLGATGYWESTYQRNITYLKCTETNNRWSIVFGIGILQNDAGALQNAASTINHYAYSLTDTAVAPSDGESLWEGPIRPQLLCTNTTSSMTMMGAVGTNPSITIPSTWGFLDSMITTLSSAGNGGMIRGTRLTVKGRLEVTDATPGSTAYDLFGLGIILTPSGVVTSNLLNETETTRDDEAAVVVAINDAGDIIWHDCAAVTGDAATTDSGFNANVTNGAALEWEMVAEHPLTATAPNHHEITVRIKDSGGTWRTILNARNPNATTANRNWLPCMWLNQKSVRCVWLWGMLEAVA